MTAEGSSAEDTRSLDRFLSGTSERHGDDGRFANESARTLCIDVDGGVWLKPGAAIAYRGTIHFDRQRILTAASPGAALLREVAPLVRAHGRGRLFCADRGAHVHSVVLDGEAVFVAWPELLAIDESLVCEPALVEHGIGIAAGGLLAMKLAGHGRFAMATHGQPLTLRVTADQPVTTDPHATVAWSPGLQLRLATDVSWRSVFGHGGHEPIQMHFEGDGFVVVQPYEDPRRFPLPAAPVERLAALIME